MRTKPPRTDAHRQRDALLQQFAALGLVPVVSTNGGVPEADIQIVKGEKHGEVIEAWLTERGEQRLQRAQLTIETLKVLENKTKVFSINVSDNH